MSTKKLIPLTVFIGLFAFTFSQLSSVLNISPSNSIKKNKEIISKNNSIIDIENYKSQLSYLNNYFNEENITFVKKNDLSSKTTNNYYNWEYFDSLYNNDLDANIKQNLAYIILVNKDLIGSLKENPKDIVLKEKVKQYTSVLIETKYIGYSVLFSAFNLLKENELDFVKQSRIKVLNYSKDDTFYKDIFKTNNIANNANNKANINKIIDNYGFLNNIQKFHI